MSSSTANEALLRIFGLIKAFGTVRALDGVDLDFAPGEIHAVLGENGAGKSTLMHVLAGIMRPDAGTVTVDGQSIRLGSPRASRLAGIGMVHQHFALVDALTVTENLALSLTPPGRWRFDAPAVYAAASKLAEEIGLELAPGSARIRDLPVGTRQRLEILKALAGAGRILILDEPTAVLTPPEVKHLFAMLARLRALGRLILFITHKLREVKEIADRVTVLRQGRVVGTYATTNVSEAELAERMVGKLDGHAIRRHSLTADALPALRVTGLTTSDSRGLKTLDDVGFVVKRGEILGVAGVDGNGQRELFAMLAGLIERASGEIEVRGRKFTQPTTVDLRLAGVGYIPPDRQQEGLVLSMSVAENLLLHAGTLRTFRRWKLLQRTRLRRHFAGLARQFKIKTAGLDAPVRSLSGGNQQRVIVARELSQPLAVLVASNPTRGLDFAATAAVAEALREAAAGGCGIVLISTDLDEILELSDTVRVLYRGRLSEALNPPINSDRLGLLMAGAGSENSGDTRDETRERRIVV